MGGGLTEANAMEAMAAREVVPVAGGGGLHVMARERGLCPRAKEATGPAGGGVDVHAYRTGRLARTGRPISISGTAAGSGEEAMEGADIHRPTSPEVAAQGRSGG